MNNLTRTLLAGVALCALTAVPAIAESAGPFHITALHGGRVVNKTKIHNHGVTHITYTFGVYATLSASTKVGTKFDLGSMQLCPAPKKIKALKKSQYGKIHLQVETYSNGCAKIDTIYKVTTPPVSGEVDTFEIILSNNFEQNGTKYKGTYNLDYTIDFE
jgi:hypothetical protein